MAKLLVVRVWGQTRRIASLADICFSNHVIWRVKPSIRLNLITAMDGTVSDVGMSLPSPYSDNNRGIPKLTKRQNTK